MVKVCLGVFVTTADILLVTVLGSRDRLHPGSG